MAAPDPLYVAARRTLLDALDALREQLEAVIVVGAQAVYLRTQTQDEGVAPFTTDGDLALDPRLLLDEPALQTAMARGGFILGDQPGTWRSGLRVGGAQIPVDLLVPNAAVPPIGRRGARLGPHGKRAAHRAVSPRSPSIRSLDLRCTQGSGT